MEPQITNDLWASHKRNQKTKNDLLRQKSMAEEIDFTLKAKQIEEDFEGEWITVFQGTKDYSETIYSGLISRTHVKKSLTDPFWDLHIGNGRPGFVFTWRKGKEVASYHRFSDDGVEPLVIRREFYGIESDYWEISEEFRRYFNLYEDKQSNKFHFIDDNGDEEEAILIEENSIRIKSKYIREFLSVKKMHLAIFFDFNHYSTKTIEEQGIKEYNDTIKGNDFCYSIGARNWDLGDGFKSHGWLMGKKLIKGLRNFEPKMFEYKNRDCEEFIIDADKDGKQITFSCDENKLADFFGKNEGSPNYLTPVLFKKEVLTKYYSQPKKYSVEDGYLRCAGLWDLRIDNNHPDYVMVFLGDLGRLSHKEQLYWKSFNVAQKGKMSYTAWARGFEAQFAEPEKADLFFKQRFTTFQEKWKRKFGWTLFLPLPKEDEYHLKTLRIPLTNEQKEFDDQILSLTKLIIDSLNEKELAKGLTLKQDAKGIDKLEKFLESQGLKVQGMIKYLRDLWDLRSCGVAHLKGEKYVKLKKNLGVDEKKLSEVFNDILIEAIWTLNSLEDRFLKE